MTRQIVLLSLAVAFLTLNSTVLATVWKVPLEYPTIQAAIDAAQPGDTIIVAEGTYTGAGNKDLDFGGKAITVRSIVPDAPSIVAATVIDCEDDGRGFYFHSGEGPDSIVSGLTIKRGRITGRPAAGGGIYCGGSSPTIEDCIITNNNAIGDYGGFDAYGGGICCTGGSSPIISNCTISNNTGLGGNGETNNGGDAKGGGIYCTTGSNPIISNCIISNNTGQGGRGGTDFEYGGQGGGWGKGGGVYCDSGSNPTIENSTISYNIMRAGSGGGSVFEHPPGSPGSSCGGGVYCSSDGIAAIDNCIINNNIAIGGPGEYDDVTPPHSTSPGKGKGGGVYGQVVISNSLVRENDVRLVPEGRWPWEVFGGGLYCTGSSSITNCLITDHELWYFNEPIYFYGPAIYCNPGSNVTITNCTISNNNYGTAAVDCTGTAQVTITNSILWDNLSADVKSDFSVTYSCIEQIVSGIGNIHTDPLFVTGPEGDYYLSQMAAGQGSDSPCVDAGSDTAANLGMYIYTTRTDEVGDRGIVDMGYHYALPYSSADIDRNGHVDFFDYAWLSMGLFYETSKQIPMGSVIVDGDLSDWPGSVEWIELDEVYYGSPDDVTEAKFALQWDDATNKVYAAVAVNDTSHVFLDEYVFWNASDRLEIYCQGNATGGSDWGRIYNVAQQYFVAPNSTGVGWASWAFGEALAEDVGFEYAVTVDGDRIIYEAGVRMFDNYGGFSGEETVITNLSQGHVVGLDLVVSTRRTPDGFGMLSENMITGKSGDAGQFARYMLVEKIFSADLDGNGSNNYADLGILFESWLDCDVTAATDPNPTNNAISVDPNVSISWVPGAGALYHDVYFGTHADAVANADHLSSEFMGTISEVHFDPCGLELGTMYYWRVDEVGPACTMQGDVWNFTTYGEPDFHLVGLWKLDEGSGTIAYDSAGTNHGTILGATWTTGQINAALSFDGDDYVEVSDDPSLRFSQYDSFSICLWAKPGGGFIICKMRASAQSGYFGYNMGHSTADNTYFLTTEKSMRGSVTIYTGIGKALSGEWSHVTAVYDNKDMKIYLDGEFEDTGTFNLDTGSTAPDKDLAIGARSVDSLIDKNFTGIIDDVRIYDRALNAGEILQLYQDGLD